MSDEWIKDEDIDSNDEDEDNEDDDKKAASIKKIKRVIKLKKSMSQPEISLPASKSESYLKEIESSKKLIDEINLGMKEADQVRERGIS